jgi:hypothetical protein
MTSSPSSRRRGARPRLTVLLALSLLPLAWSGVAAAQPVAVDPAWRACTVDEECEAVSFRCCACGENDYIGVSAAFADAARQHLRPECNAPCPSQMCLRQYEMCEAGTCVVSETPSARLVEREAVLRLVDEGQRAGWERHDLEGYMAQWASEARLVAGRAPEPGPHDWSLQREAIRATRQVRFAEPLPVGRSMNVELVAFTLEGDGALLQTRTTLRQPGYVEAVGEHYRLHRSEAGWRVVENRWWPLETIAGAERIVYDEAYWQAADAEVEAARAAGEPGALVDALTRAYRFPEALEAMRAWTAEPDAPAALWLVRARLALLVGEVSDGREAWERARQLDPTVPAPPFD